jgi:hypothetical protein
MWYSLNCCLLVICSSSGTLITFLVICAGYTVLLEIFETNFSFNQLLEEGLQMLFTQCLLLLAELEYASFYQQWSWFHTFVSAIMCISFLQHHLHDNLQTAVLISWIHRLYIHELLSRSIISVLKALIWFIKTDAFVPS